MKKPLVSIIIPNYNRASLIGETLDSVKAQTFLNWETIIVDDRSTDHSVDVVQEYVRRDNRFKLITRSRLPKGAQTCRNLGVEAASGEFIIFLDSDDLLERNCIQNRVIMMQKDPHLDYAVFAMQRFQKHINDNGGVWLYHDFDDVFTSFLLRAQWQTTSPIWRRAALDKVGAWDEQLLRWQDWDFHVRALMKNLAYKIYPQHIDAYYRDNYREDETDIDTIAQIQDNITDLFVRTTTAIRKAGMLSTVNSQIIAGNTLRAAGVLNNLDQFQTAENLWMKAYAAGLVNKRKFNAGLYYLRLKRIPMARQRVIAALLRRLFAVPLSWRIASRY